MRIQRDFSELKRDTQDFDILWNAADDGLIASWERGREKANEDPMLAQKALAGELPVLPWRGGVPKEIKSKVKHGNFRYLAMWQGLRSSDLDIDPAQELILVCSSTGVHVTFTSDINKYGKSVSDETDL